MARLTRKNIKVFAENATDNGVFGSLQANNPTTTSDVEQIQSLSAWSDGWNSATETSEMLPPLEEFQGVQYVTTYQQAYLMQEGIPEWAATVTYYKGSLTKEVTSTGFRIYNSLTDNNAGNLLSDTSNWKKVMDSDDLYAFDNSVVHKAGAETITGAKTFTGDGWITKIQNTDVTYNTAPSSNKSTGIAFVDKNGTQMGIVECYRFTDNSTVMQLNTYGPNGEFGSALQFKMFPDGHSIAYAPTPYVNAYGNEIATAAFVTTADSNLQNQINTKATPAQVSTAISTMLATLYPVGSLYIGTQNSCPLASLISGSQWQIIATDCALWGGNGSNGNTWIPAGLPNITGQISCIQDVNVTTQGQFAYYSPTGGSGGGIDTANGTSGNINFDASRVSSIYGNSNTVQPPAYRVNVWRRTA